MIINKKIIVLVFLGLIVFSVAPKITFAQISVFETNPILVGQQTIFQQITSVQSITTALQSTFSALIEKAMNVQQLFEWAFKIAAEALRRQLLNMIVDQIVVWIQGGGNPKFITDWPGFFRDAIDQAGGQFIEELGAGALCSPFKLSLRTAFIPIPRFSDRSACTLSSIGVNIDNFLKDFNKGSWVAWNEMILKPQNNVYGAYLMAWDEYERRKSAAQKAAESEAYAGQGFLSVKRCVLSHNEEQFDEDGNTLGFKNICDKQEVVTPGKVVGELAGQALGSDIPYIISAQDFAAYVSAITNAILNRVFAEGVGLLHSAVSSGGGGGVTPGGSTQAQCTPFLGTPAYNECVNAIQSGIDVQEFQKNHLVQLVDLDLGFQNQLLGAKQTTLIILTQSLDTLQQLEACQASPHPDTAKTQGGISVITGQIAGIQSDIIALQLKQQQIKDETDKTKIPSLYAEVAGIVNPAATQSLALAAQEETNQKQIILTSYQSSLSSCLAQQLLEQQQAQQKQLQQQP